MSVVWLLIFILYPISIFAVGLSAFYFGYKYRDKEIGLKARRKDGSGSDIKE